MNTSPLKTFSNSSLKHLGKLILLYQFALILLATLEIEFYEINFWNPLHYFQLVLALNIIGFTELSLGYACTILVLEGFLLFIYLKAYFKYYKKSKYKNLWLCALGIANIGFTIRAFTLLLWFLFKDFSLFPPNSSIN